MDSVTLGELADEVVRLARERLQRPESGTEWRTPEELQMDLLDAMMERQEEMWQRQKTVNLKVEEMARQLDLYHSQLLRTKLVNFWNRIVSK